MCFITSPGQGTCYTVPVVLSTKGVLCNWFRMPRNFGAGLCGWGITSISTVYESWGRRPSSDDSFHSPTVIPPSALNKLSIMKCYVQSHLTSSFADNGMASWYSVCWVPIVEWQLDSENYRHLTVVGLHDTGPWLELHPLPCLHLEDTKHTWKFSMVYKLELALSKAVLRVEIAWLTC